MEGKITRFYDSISINNFLYWSKIMPNSGIIASVEIEEYEETDDVGKDDFAFVLGPDGDLKTFMIPEHLMTDPPEEVKMILALFGIDDIHELENRVLH
jgi:hypothetical protein